MLATSVIIVLREVLEASLIISVLLALSRFLQMPLTWIRSAILFGGAGAFLYGFMTGAVSNWFNGVGQEVVNAGLQLGICACIILITAQFGTRHTHPPDRNAIRRLSKIMSASVAFAIIREGSEIFLYLSGFMAESDLLSSVLTGGMAGAGIGISVGALTYFGLLNLNRKWSANVCIALLALITAGMAGQATNMLIQADWLPAQTPLWNTSAWLAEDSIPGQLLYALIGYEASPSPVQATVYFSALLLPLLAVYLLGRAHKAGEPGD